MRLKGTGKDPENRYPEGLIFDAPEHVAQKTIEAGFAVALDPKDDPARTDSQIAGAVQRGDSLSDPVDHELAQDLSEPDALAKVQGADVNDPIPGGAVARAPVGRTTEDPAAVQARAEKGDQVGSTETPSGSAPSSSKSGKELTPKQEAVARAKELDVSSSGTQAEIEERIAAKEKELEEQNAEPSAELVQRAEELEIDSSGTTAEVEARIAAKEQELAGASQS